MKKSLARFLMAGGLATIFQYAVLEMGTGLFGWSAALASGAGYLAGSMLSYLMNYFFTFSSTRPHIQAAIRFYGMVAVGWGINTVVMAVFVDYIGWNKWLSQVLATGLALIWNFLALRSWVFKTV